MTEDLDTRRDAVRRHLDQAGFRVLPEAEPSRDDPEAYRASVDADLARSVVFVQLLSETPGRTTQGVRRELRRPAAREGRGGREAGAPVAPP